MRRIRSIAVLVSALAAAVVLSGCAAKPSAPTAGGGGAQSVIVKLQVLEVPRGVGDSVKRGQVVRVKSSGIVVGTVEKTEVTPAALANPDSKGHLIESPSPVTDDLMITIKGQAVVADTGYRFGNGNLYVNWQDSYLTPTTVLKGTIVAIDVE
jgi:hypothetical protein